MAGWDWNAIYLSCFGVGLALTSIAFVGGGLNLHVGHLHLHGHSLRGHGNGGGVSPLNGFTLMAFLCWFGGAGYLLHRGTVFSLGLILLLAVLGGMAAASLVFWFLASVLMPQERTLKASDTEITGVVGRLNCAVPRHGVGELLYSQNGVRKSASVRSDDGDPIDRGAEVIIMRYARGVGYVKRWDEFEHGLSAEALNHDRDLR